GRPRPRRAPRPSAHLPARSRAVRRHRPMGRELRAPVGGPARLAGRVPARHPDRGAPDVITQLLRKKKELHLERSYTAPVEAVWRAWTEADRLRAWWGPEKTTIGECEVDLRVGGRLFIVTVASEAMGKYAGTRWPMEGTFTRIDDQQRLTYDARSWTEGEEATSTIHHTNDITLTPDGHTTKVTL